jgi:acetoin utilization protein AcuB
VLDLSLALFEKLKEHKDKDIHDLVKLEDIITLDPIVVSPETDAAEAARIMVERRLGGLPVFDGKLRGMITKSDVVKGFKLIKDMKMLR